MTLTFDIQLTSLIHLVECFNQLCDLGLRHFPKIIFTFSHTKIIVTKFDIGIKWVKVII